MHTCLCGEKRYKRIKTYTTQYGVVRLVSCCNCGLARDIREYDHGFLYTDQANIYHPPDNIDFQDRISGWERHLDFIRPHLEGSGKVLDIGCNDGSFLALLQKHGWSGIGVEANKSMVEFAISKGLNVINKPLGEALLTESSFNLIAASHVLEHIPDLGQTLKCVMKLLRPGGYLFVIVPNYGCCIARMVAGVKGRVFLPGQHIWYFTKESLKSSCALFGLKLVKYGTINDLSIGSKIPFGSLIKRLFNFWMRLTNNSLEIVGLFQKPL